jgi:hypothetical protein
MDETTTGEGEALAWLCHLEPLLAGRRTLVVCAPGEVRSLQAWLAGRGLVRALAVADEAGIAPHFDRIVVHPRPGAPLDPGRIAGLGALLAPEGLLAVGVLPEDAGAEALLRQAFPVVEKAALLPFAGWAVVPAGAGAGEVTWDGTALPAQRPGSLLLLCGARPSGLAGATVVALPLPEPRAPDLPLRALEEGGAAQLSGAREAELSAEVLALSWRREELERDLALAVAERDALRARLEGGAAGAADPSDLLSP